MSFLSTKASLQVYRRIIVTSKSTSALHFNYPINISRLKDNRNNSNEPVGIESSSPSFSSMSRLSFIKGDTSIFCRQFCSSTNSATATTRNHAKKNPTMLERTDKNFIHCMYDKYSMSQQKNRILIAESLFQAAISQASDP
mmetsp:Transcript_58902/g.65898  ORF Transcript_58902/g.65898 Transcript_58902/m.65898 type:complete len:141 (-) Transcript_58902:947-1369(-)